MLSLLPPLSLSLTRRRPFHFLHRRLAPLLFVSPTLRPLLSLLPPLSLSLMRRRPFRPLLLRASVQFRRPLALQLAVRALTVSPVQPLLFSVAVYLFPRSSTTAPSFLSSLHNGFFLLIY
ncbi:hypothetical protein GGR02_000649 [Anoxybacillus voinovskiensis]|uniref:Uncharacterized protein n=1 Tax=Anoxybacteroides voinovskiense TaxID=230470 RepID=A0A840DTM7_9BACL|nr:hypothetical protein [Anoxybacillus voinovskiensis]